MDGTPAADDAWTLAGRRFRSRLIVGTGKYKDLEETAAAIEASGAEIVTVAVRRVNLSDPSAPMLQDYVDPEALHLSAEHCRMPHRERRGPHTAARARGRRLEPGEAGGARTAADALPDMPATFEAAAALIKDGFEVMVYCADDPLAAKRLEEMGCVAIMPLGAPIGSGLGVQNPAMIWMMREQATVPFLVDAGVGTASDAAIAMELGCDAVLLNSAIAHARDPVRMARAMRLAVEAGRLSYLAGRMPRRMGADPSSPLTGLIR